MKHNWEYKPLKNQVDILYGCPFESGCFNTDSKGMPLIRIRDVKPGFTTTYFDGSFSNEYIIKKGEYLIGMDGEFNIAPWQSEDALLNQRVCRVKSKNEEHFLTDYLFYFLGKELKKIEEKTSFVTVKHLSAKVLNSILIPVPPMEEQNRIVSELDTISAGISALREQVKDLDNLAQSIFYETFGDPITNPKGWEVKQLNTVSELINGRAYKQDELLDSGKYRIVRVGNFFTNNEYYYSNLELSEDKYLVKGDLLFAWSASFGAFIWEGEKVIFHYHIWKILYDEKQLNKIFYKFLLNEMTSSFMKDLHGIGMLHLTKAGMEKYMLPVPPLELQEQFAEQIEMIEAMKSELEKQIADAQTILDSRMDYWFN